MSRCLLGAIMYIEKMMREKSEWSLEDEEKVKKILENFRNFEGLQTTKREPEKGRKPRLSDQIDYEIESAVRLLVEFSGFEEIDPGALEKLKNVYHRRFLQSSRQLSAAERRKKDGLEIPYKSPLEWTLKLNGVQKVLEIKQWYDTVYLTRWTELKKKFE